MAEMRKSRTAASKRLHKKLDCQGQVVGGFKTQITERRLKKYLMKLSEIERNNEAAPQDLSPRRRRRITPRIRPPQEVDYRFKRRK